LEERGTEFVAAFFCSELAVTVELRGEHAQYLVLADGAEVR
jgi:hypothetical protein